jgi:hypothetical protein
MKIRFVSVTPDILPQVRAEVDMLRSAVNIGDMVGVDTATAKLLTLTNDCRSVDLSEEEWRMFLKEIRNRNPSLHSNYLLPAEVCADILPAFDANDFVLELPFNGEAEKEVYGV